MFHFHPFPAVEKEEDDEDRFDKVEYFYEEYDPNDKSRAVFLEKPQQLRTRVGGRVVFPCNVKKRK